MRVSVRACMCMGRWVQAACMQNKVQHFACKVELLVGLEHQGLWEGSECSNPTGACMG